MRAIDYGQAGAASLEESWNRLALATPQPDPFSATTHWQLAFYEALDPHASLVVRQSDEGLIQFARRSVRGAQALLPIERNWLFGCNLLGAGALDLLGALLDELASGETTQCAVVVSGLEPGGALLGEIEARFADRYELTPHRGGLQCAASLSGGLDGFLARRSANGRRNLRRVAKRAAENGVLLQRHAPRTAEEAEAVFARMLAVELRSWKGLGQCGMESPRMSRFYSTMLRRLARAGDARVIFATFEGDDIGFIFGGLAGGIYRGQQFSFDNEFAVWSIGNLMQFEQVRWLCEEGAKRYDLGPLLGPSMQYKHHWTELQLPIQALVIRPR